MFQAGLTILCAVFVIGYIFFSAGAEQDSVPARTELPELPEQQQDVA